MQDTPPGSCWQFGMGVGRLEEKGKKPKTGFFKQDFAYVGNFKCGILRLCESVCVCTEAWMMFTDMSTVVTTELQASGDFLLFKTLQFCKFLYKSIF